jgi:hypothetical protein
VVFLVSRVQLQQQLTRARNAIVNVAVGVFRKRVCSEEFSVPATTRPHVAHGDEWLSFNC